MAFAATTPCCFYSTKGAKDNMEIKEYETLFTTENLICNNRLCAGLCLWLAHTLCDSATGEQKGWNADILREVWSFLVYSLISQSLTSVFFCETTKVGRAGMVMLEPTYGQGTKKDHAAGEWRTWVWACVFLSTTCGSSEWLWPCILWGGRGKEPGVGQSQALTSRHDCHLLILYQSWGALEGHRQTPAVVLTQGSSR